MMIKSSIAATPIETHVVVFNQLKILTLNMGNDLRNPNPPAPPEPNFSDWLRANEEIVNRIWEQSKMEFELVEKDSPSHVSVNHLQESSREAFGRGAIWALRKLTQDRWISVKERLPEIGQEVIVYSPPTESGDSIVTALCRKIRYEGAMQFYWDNDYGGGNIYIQEAITHWQPLPDAPLPKYSPNRNGNHPASESNQ